MLLLAALLILAGLLLASFACRTPREVEAPVSKITPYTGPLYTAHGREIK